MTDPIIAEERLRSIVVTMGKALEELPMYDAGLASDNQYGTAYTYYLVFVQESLLERSGLSLSEAERIYNMYYWFLVFSGRYQAKHGCDVGLEQQSFKMLESISCDVDWSCLEAINRRATEEAKR